MNCQTQMAVALVHEVIAINVDFHEVSAPLISFTR